MPLHIRSRRGTAAEWTAANPTLLAGEIGFESDTGLFKMGDGASTWTALDYAADAAGSVATHAALTSGTHGATGTIAEVGDIAVDANLSAAAQAAITASHARSHTLVSTSDHSSSVAVNKHYKADANGLPVDATNTDAAVAAAVTASASLDQHWTRPPAVGQYGTTPGTWSGGGAAITANKLYGFPFYLPWPGVTWSHIVVPVTAVVGSDHIRIGLHYATAGLWTPAALWQDCGATALAAAGVAEIALPTPIVGPVLAVISFVGDVAFSLDRNGPATTGVAPFGPAIYQITSGNRLAAIQGLQRAFAYAALPDPWGTADAELQTGIFRFGFKRSA